MLKSRYFWRLFSSLILLSAFAVLLHRIVLSRAGLPPLEGSVLSLALCAGLAAWLAAGISRPVRMLGQTAGQVAGTERLPRTDDELHLAAEALSSLDRASRDTLETIAAERNQLRAILGGMVEGVIAIDREERIVHMNRAAGEALALDSRQCLHRKVWVAIRIPAITESLTAAAQSGEEQRGELRLARPTQDQVIELYSSPLVDAQGRIAGAVMVLHDVTELRHLEAVRRDFVANVSHELKTPVTAIHAMAETMEDDPGMDAGTRHRFLRRVSEQSTRLSALVSDLLSLSRIESASQPMELQMLDLRDPAREALAMQHAPAETKGVALSSEIPDESVEVLLDPESMRQAIGNLLDNAVKYTPRGGKVTLRLSRERGRAIVAVQDSGIGIEPVHQARLFERFYRVDKARSRELGGTGLGLAIVKHVALAHGGAVRVVSAPGRGSTFFIDLPLAT